MGGYKEATDRIANIAGEDATRKGNVDHALRRHTVVVGLPDHTAGAAGDVYNLIYPVDKDLTVVSFKITESIAVAANDTDYNEERLVYNDLAGGADTNITDLMTTKVTGGAAYVANVPKTFTGITLASTVAAGKGIFLKNTHGGAGKAKGARSAVLVIDYGP